MSCKNGKEKEKVALSATSMARLTSEEDEESDMLSPLVKKKKSELLEMTAADAGRVKEALKAKICSWSSEDVSAPPSSLHPKFQVKKKSTM